MSETLHRQLNVLIVLASAILGLALTYVFFSDEIGVLFVVFAVAPATVIVIAASAYVEGATEQQGAQ